ncbi:hypothetical protein SDC9_152334 [bioreactor metagenome]|uniref:Uncharacterized protein n=1 Tax=bioreactor metagenome TaxID=1076179 RepID=A0A645EXB5_9ZZZZ
MRFIAQAFDRIEVPHDQVPEDPKRSSRVDGQRQRALPIHVGSQRIGSGCKQFDDELLIVCHHRPIETKIER